MKVSEAASPCGVRAAGWQGKGVAWSTIAFVLSSMKHHLSA
jgi:hypothetical protein